MSQDHTRLIPGFIFLTVLVVYLCFPTKLYYWDGVDFAQTIEDARGLDTSLIHPNHLVYEGFGYLIYKAIRGVGIDARALTVLQITNSILSALAALLLFHILRLSLRSPYLSCALTFLYAFSATWWRFSTDAGAYVPSVLLMLVSFYLILPSTKPRPLLLLALVYSLSMCFHQLAVIFYPVLALGVFWRIPELARKERIYNVLKFSLLAFIITFGAYSYCFYLATASLDFMRLMRWLTSFSPDVSFSFNAGSNLGFTLRGYLRLFFGGRFNLLKGLFNPFIIALMVVLSTLLLLFIRQLIRSLKVRGGHWKPSLKFAAQHRPLLLLCGLWAIVYTIFLFVWLPHHTFYRLFYLPALILLTGLWLASIENFKTPARTFRLALFVAIMSLTNFLFLIFPYSHAEKYPPLSLAAEMNRVWPRGTIIYYAATNADLSLFRYFNPLTTWKQMNPGNTVALESELRQIYNGGAQAWLEVTAIEQLSATPQGADWLAAHAKESSTRELADSSYKIKYVQVVP